MAIRERERLSTLLADYFDAYLNNKFDRIYILIDAIKKLILDAEVEYMNLYLFYLEALTTNTKFIRSFSGSDADLSKKIIQLKAELNKQSKESIERLLFLCPEQSILALEQFSIKDLCYLNALPVNPFPVDFIYYIRYNPDKKTIFFLYDKSTKIDYCEYVGKIMPMNNDCFDGLYDYHIPVFKLVEQSTDYNVILTNNYINIGNNTYFYVHTISHITDFLRKHSNSLHRTIAQQTLNDINSGKALYVLNSAQEGVPVAPYYYIIQSFLKKYINPVFYKHYIVLSGNIFEQRAINLFNQKKIIPSFKIFNSFLNYVYSNLNNIPINLYAFRYFEYCISLQFKRHYASYSYDVKLAFLMQNKFYTFLCFNGHEKDFRYAFCFLLWKNNLMESGAISLRRIESIGQLTLPHNRRIISNVLKMDLHLLNTFLKQLPFRADKKNVQLNYWYQVDMNLINNTFLWIITETTFSDNFLNFSFSYLTEKTYKPIALFMPFIMVGDRYSLKRLKEDGYLTFDKWWSEEYDNVIDAVERLYVILNLVETLSKKSIQDKIQMYADMKDVLLHNHKILMDKSEVPFFKSMIYDNI